MDRRHALGLLAGLAAVMGMKPVTDEFSQFLRLAFLRSPNYVAGVSGWTINQDGSVEFNNGTFRGFIVGGRLFLYSGTPGAGNPPVAYAAPPGVTTDPFGNVLPVTTGGFVVSSSATGQFGVLQNAALLLGSVNVSTRIIADGTLALLDALADNVAPGIAITGPSTPTGGGAQVNVLGESKDASKPAQIVMGAPIAAPSTAALLEVQGTIAAKLLTAIVGGAAETWHNATLAAGFSAGGTTPRFRLEPDGIAAGTVRLDGAVNLTATEAANTTMFTMPAGYLPAHAHDYVTKSTLSGLNPGAGVMPATVHVTPSGQVQIAVNGVSGNFVVLDGITIPLD